MTSRLDRLLLLLDNAPSPAVRDTAARQIAQFAAKSVRGDVSSHVAVVDVDAPAPSSSSSSAVHATASEWQEVMAVVGKILPYLHSKSLDTRNAASLAILHICQLVPLWTPYSFPVSSSNFPPDPASPAPEFPPFSVAQLIQSGSLLLASSGKEFAQPTYFGTPAEVERARQEAMKRLGLGFLNGVGDDLDNDLEKELAVESSNIDESGSDVKMEDIQHTNGHNNGNGASVKHESEHDASAHDIKSRLKVNTRIAQVKSEDSTLSAFASPNPTPSSEEPPALPVDTTGMSAREINRLKRKRKPGNTAFIAAAALPLAQPSKSNNTPAAQPSAPPPSKVRLTESGPRPSRGRPQTPSASASARSTPGPAPTSARKSSTPKAHSQTPTPEKIVIDPTKGGQVDAKERAQSKALEVAEGHWVWSGVVGVLLVDLFSPAWEVRHGAALALREIIKVQGASGGMKEELSPEENALVHEKWCNDLAAKFLCVFVLDRFGDFVSDQVMAPVRETVSQTLASLLLHMPRRSVVHVHRILLQMILQDSVKVEPRMQSKSNGKGKQHVWEVRHAGLLGIKYEVAVRSDLVEREEGGGKEVLKGVVDAAVLGLSDGDDDVRSVAASCLIPVAAYLVERLPEEIPRVTMVLWSCLENMKDDLGSSVGAVMALLGKLVTFDKVIAFMADPNASRSLSLLAPALFPFFRHTISNVRLAVVNTLLNFLAEASLPRDWVSTPFLCLLFQNLIVEERDDVRDASFRAWKAVLPALQAVPGLFDDMAGPSLRDWFGTLMTPLGTPIDTSVFYHPSFQIGDGLEHAHPLDKPMVMQDLSLVSMETIIRGRVIASKALAVMFAVWPVETQHMTFGHLLLFYQTSPSMLQQFLTATIIQEWAEEVDTQYPPSPDQSALLALSPVAAELQAKLLTFLESELPSSYHEMYLVLSRISTECRNLLQSFTLDAKVPQSKIPQLPVNIDLTGTDENGFTIDVAHDAVGSMFTTLKASLGRTKKKEQLFLEEQRQKVLLGISQYAAIKEQHDIRVSAAVAGAVIALRLMPAKLNPVIRSVMNGVKFEENIDLQTRAARSVALFVSIYASAASSRANPTEKIVKNLCTFVCQDTTVTPVFSESKKVLDEIVSSKKVAATKGGKASAREEPPPESEEVVKAKLVRRGAQFALAEIAKKFGASLFEMVPKLWECLVQPLSECYVSGVPQAADELIQKHEQMGQDVIDCLTLLPTVVPYLHAALYPLVVKVFPAIILSLRSRYAIIRHSAAKCFSTICDVITTEAMRFTIENVISFLGDSTVLSNRQGAMELISHIVQKLDMKALPYVIFMIVPVLGRMSDSDDHVRFLATNTFASLVKMVPLEAGLPDPPGFSAELLQRREHERDFLVQLLDGSKVEPYKIPVPIGAELRPYQQEGVNWLAFLAKYQLHGILCDDMGLGKTLQSICILASKHHERAEKHKATKSPDSTHLPSLIVCPPTLTGHWYHEILKYTTTLRPVIFTGPTRDRARLLPNLGKYDVVITSYDVVRSEAVNLSKMHFHYCILDEGHTIKNAKTKLTKAVKTIQAHHRLILSGTPIQNNVLELWSLFDFLMPGFLGTEHTFNERFSKPILSTRDGKASGKNLEAAAQALEALHKQILPFVLRRLKEDVLNDLPPKIIQDYYCDLSDVQKHLYDEFSASQARHSAEEAVRKASGEKSHGQQHVFQSLQYLRKLCDHPALVVKDPAAQASLLKDTGAEPSPHGIRDIVHAPKLQALRQLLLDCGIGKSTDGSEPELPRAGLDEDVPVSQHRVLIFCQLKLMLDIVENDLFKAVMPSVTYMRLDGSTDPNKRHAIVQTFNADPSIDCLLLTTHIGGLGLTLTGADTVIFVEHDWNPQKDLQAMDRAHRLGQKKVVNVYRLITRGTLEEKIMGIQSFKLNMANSVITQQNSGLESMDTDLVLDLFRRTTEEEDAKKKKKQQDPSRPVNQKNLLEGLEDLPAEDEYEGLDLSSFLGSIGR
ncbi:hypothetical protein BOTBODRAFT_39402 [Botryobasidium botryosum FD-172 SS1]|uniref:TATA-binding protein-associated factor mot1 n=1 Tax=Botryobasidium botryosum (strain FD-172 SS1) TaxID=930990 RepID=A0A067LWS4_BOTB1|nr:hypothetical protein BOTBODRAFT_39402 [Botryobasidium botryosum FD-172 SS1]